MANNSQFVSLVAPATVTAGETFAATVTMRNSGTTTWSPATHKLGSQSPQDNFRWGADRFPLLAQPVAPGSDGVFSGTFTAPSAGGDYAFDWKCVEEFVAWFGATAQHMIHVVGSPLPFPPMRADPGDLVSAKVFDTGPFNANAQTLAAPAVQEWVNETGGRLLIKKARVWTGVERSKVCDVHAQLEREDGSLLAVNAWDHYANPTLPLHGITEDFSPYFALEPGEKLILRYWNDPFGQVLKIHHCAYVWAQYSA